MVEAWIGLGVLVVIWIVLAIVTTKAQDGAPGTSAGLGCGLILMGLGIAIIFLFLILGGISAVEFIRKHLTWS